MTRITKAGFARAKAALGIKKVTKKNIGRIMKKFHSSKKGGSKSRKLTKTNKKTIRRTRKLTRRKKKRGARKFTLPLAPIIGLLAGTAPAIEPALDGDFDGAINILKFNYLGLTHDNQFNAEGLKKGLLPLILGGLIHKFVGGAPLNINRMLASANVPVIRI